MHAGGGSPKPSGTTAVQFNMKGCAGGTGRIWAGLGAGALALVAVLAGIERGERLAPGPGTAARQALPMEAEPAPMAPPAPLAPGWDLANIEHHRVDYWVARLQTDRRPIFESALRLRGRYGPMVSGALAEREMPQDLLYLAMIESGFDPRAYSSAHASGLWQFVRETGKRYGLEVNRAVDERRDPVESTEAALRYLTALHRRFGSWYLAAAAYNTGENRVGRVMREEKGRERGTDAEFYEIFHRLPAQTRDYVPVMIAAARIGKDPAAYGFDVEPLPAWSFREVTAAPATPLATLARRAGTTVAALKELNPHLALDRTRNDRSMVVRVPAAPAEAAD
jgi:membrane-bound lytic murein transglycosylase D